LVYGDRVHKVSWRFWIECRDRSLVMQCYHLEE